jgi:hypothetical protein
MTDYKGMIGWMTTGNADHCHGCGRPPYHNVNGIMIPLKRCSRCKQAWYHNSDCQRKDLKRHRQQEGCSAFKQVIEQLPVSEEKQLYYIMRQEKKGKCVMASKLLRKGDIVLLDKNPIVPPVLREEYRLQRCAICFAKLNHNNQVHRV